MSSENEKERELDEYIARKSKIVAAREFEGNGIVLVFNSAKVTPNKPGKFGPVVEYIVKSVPSNIERIVNASAISLLIGLREKLEKPYGTDVPLHVKKTGSGMDSKYSVDHAN